MSEKKKINRREFLKLGSLMALSVPFVNVIDKIGDAEIVESEEEFGGFAIRRHKKEDPPYKVDDHYQRFDMRKALNPLTMGTVGITALIRAQNGELGFSRPGLALEEAGWTVSNAFGSFSLFGDGGLYSWTPLVNAGFHGAPDYGKELGPWDFESEGYSLEDVTRSVKKAAKLYGASMVGVAELDQRWFYGKSVYMDSDELMRGVVGEAAAEGVDLSKASELSGPEILMATMQNMDKQNLKDFVIHTVEIADPSMLPEGVSVAALRAMPASMLQAMLPTVVPTFSKEFLHLIATELDPSLLPANFDPDSILMEEIYVADISETMPAGEIRFEDIAEPYNDKKNMVQGIPNSMKHVIVMAFEEDPDGNTLEHSCESAAAVSNAYSRMAFTAASLAQYIRFLGYQAIPMGNDTGLSVPMAIDAGLGELSRIGILITPKYGPRVRLAKVITDLPLQADEPISFGVTEFCEICGKCADNCPSGAIPHGERNYEAPSTGNPGVYKWAADGGKCLKYWADTGSGCSQCIVTCPFNKPEGWLHDATRILIGAKSGSVDRILLKLDEVSGYGKPESCKDYWAKDNYIHIKA